MNIKLSDNTIEGAEKLILTLIIGLMSNLKLKIVSLNEVELQLFNPCTIAKLKEKGVRQDIIDLVHLGTELEDVLSLLPEQLDSGIDDILNRAISLYSDIALDISVVKKWVDS